MQPRLALDIGWADILSVVASPCRDRRALEARIAAFAPSGTTAVVAQSVRTLFDAVLAECSAGCVVSLSAVTIQGMADLARVHGCRVRPMDIDLDTLAPAEAPDDEAAMVVVAHLFGRRPAVAPRSAALVIEDCAQAYAGALTLSPGADGALSSFGPIKAMTALGGGVGLFRDAELAARIRARLDRHPVLGEGWFLRRLAKYAALKVLCWPPVYGGVLGLIRATGRDADAVIGSAGRGFGPGPIAEAVRRRPPRRLLALLARRLAQSPDAVGRAAADSAARALAAHQTIPGLASPGGWWLLPVLTPHPDRLVTALAQRGFDATRGATSLRAVSAENAPAPSNASRLMAEVVYVPKPATASEADRLVRAVLAAMQEIEGLMGDDS